ncbi:MAG: tetratricopeptide repeat protein [Longimicrobiaceae bacterium]
MTSSENPVGSAGNGSPFPDPIPDLEERFAGVERLLGQAEDGGGDRARARDQILSLFRDTERAIDRLAGFKERIRALVERYKALSPAARPEGLSPGPARSDHLGSSTYVERGWSAIAAGDHARAVSELKRALELAPGDSKAESLLGWAQMLLDEYDEALFTYQRVLAREPRNDIARVNLGYICLKKGIFGEAIEHLSRAIRRGNDRKAVLYATLYLGLVYREREMYADARGFFERAIELGPKLIEAYWELGAAHYAEGDPGQAREAWRGGVEANRFNPWGERCGEALALLDAGEAVNLSGPSLEAGVSPDHIS